jgi:hypothetical protein
VTAAIDHVPIDELVEVLLTKAVVLGSHGEDGSRKLSDKEATLPITVSLGGQPPLHPHGRATCLAAMDLGHHTRAERRQNLTGAEASPGAERVIGLPKRL